MIDPVLSGIVISLILLISGLLIWKFASKGKFQRSLLFILLIGAVLRIYTASDPYLHVWDERYHALVAKNMIEHPLKPTLHEHPILDYQPQNWSGNHIWLEKPPVPLLLMSGSIALFGNNVYAVRLPSFLLGLLAIWLTFMIGRILFYERVGLVAAFLHAIHGSVIELAAGRLSSDHVETALIVFAELGIFLSIYFFERKRTILMAAAIGAVGGLAFLSKLYPAGIIFIAWGIGAIYWKKYSFSEILKFGGVILTAFALVTLPWILYILTAYPVESEILFGKYIGAYSATVDRHDAPFYYYFHKLMVMFGELIYIPIGFAFFALYRNENRGKYLVLLTWALIPVLIFSFGDTKRFTYILISASAFFLLTAVFWNKLLEWKTEGVFRLGIILILFLLLALPLRFSIERTKLFKDHIETEFYQANINCKSWSKELDENDIVFGTDYYIELMFYSDVHAAYRRIPNEDQMDSLRLAGFDIFLLEDNEHLINYGEQGY